MIAVLREIIAPVLVGILVGIITSIITNIKYKNEKTWELKVSNYQMLIEGLAKLKYLVRTELDDLEMSRTTVNKNVNWNKANSLIDSAADRGLFIFTNNVNKAIEEFRISTNDAADHDYYLDHLNDIYVATEKCLQVVIKEAKKTLKI